MVTFPAPHLPAYTHTSLLYLYLHLKQVSSLLHRGLPFLLLISTPLPHTVQLEAPKVEGGVVLTVGMGDVGQLGLGPDVEEKTRPGVVDLPEGIVAIAAGGLHTVCLDKNGKVRVCASVFMIIIFHLH